MVHRATPTAADADAPDTLFERAYPEALRARERELLGARDGHVGVALSGGGIRSATFALGVFQAIAQLHLLGRIDFLSTVSGGGYFGAFLGRLWHRDYIRSVADVERVLTGPHAEDDPDCADHAAADEPARAQLERSEAGWKVLGWLRENGRYLAPLGSGDMLLGGAVLLRNWFSVHCVLGVFFLFALLLLQLPRVLASWLWPDVSEPFIASLRDSLAPGALLLSPWSWLALVPAALALPMGWAYWLVARDTRGTLATWAERATVFVSVVVAWILGGAALIGWTQASADTYYYTRAAGLAMAVSGLLAVLFWAAAAFDSFVKASAAPGRRMGHIKDALLEALRSGHDPQGKLFRDASTRNTLSLGLRTLLLLAALGAGLAAIDSAGESLYRLATVHGFALRKWSAGMAAVVAALSGLARQVVVWVGPRTQGKRPQLPVKLLAGVCAFALGFALLSAVAALAHAVAWNFSGWNPYDVHPVPRLRNVLMWLAASLVFALAFGHAHSFLNRSSHLLLYSDRLVRAYLGASNPKRWCGRAVPVRDPIADDDIELHEYWGGLQPGAAKRMPIHLVNVTINETYDGQSQLQQQDRKGVGMALGPAAISVGIRHHAVMKGEQEGQQGPVVKLDRVYPVEGRLPQLAAVTATSRGEQPAGEHMPFRVFHYPQFGVDGRLMQARASAPAGAKSAPEQFAQFPWQPLSLGNWVGISGAAFSTGTGFRTSLGLSMLAGLGNIRLGYWWDAGVHPEQRAERAARRSSWLARTMRAVFPVQSALLAEFMARFPGTARQRWYLSDGGHFENMGAYELIRRRLPWILIVDAEADPDYTFEGLANLVRKARLDFQTEIEFLSAEALQSLLRGGAGAPWFGALDQLRPALEPGADDEAGRLRRAKAHCALARVRYPAQQGGGRDPGWLVYIKPGLDGSEPADVLQYARENPAFPQQPTADQFFDEAQWESYRKLGQHIGLGALRALIHSPIGPGFGGAAKDKPVPSAQPRAVELADQEG